jgi:hypothetical protein
MKLYLAAFKERGSFLPARSRRHVYQHAFALKRNSQIPQIVHICICLGDLCMKSQIVLLKSWSNATEHGLVLATRSLVVLK